MNNPEARLKSFILRGMEKFKIKSVMTTFLHMTKLKIITKEAMENDYNRGQDFFGGNISVNDDLDSFFEDLRHGKEPDEKVRFYFLPKLTEEELELVDRKDANYLKTFLHDWDTDVKKAQMNRSKSDSKFVHGIGSRRTFTIEYSSDDADENISENLSLNVSGIKFIKFISSSVLFAINTILNIYFSWH